MSLAGICASAVPVSTTVVGRSLPFQRTTEVLEKFEPYTQRLKAPAPAGAPIGSRELMVGTGFVPVVTLKFSVLDVPPPGAELVTVTDTVPAAARAAAGMAAVICVALITVVVSAIPPKLTVEPETLVPLTTGPGMKLFPFIVSVREALPARAVLGDTAVIFGTGFEVVNEDC